MTEATCIAPGCESPVLIVKRKMCRPCYMRAWSAGEFGTPTPHRNNWCAGADKATRHRAWQRKTRCGLLPEDIERMLEAIGHQCEICKDPINEKTARVDHDHDCCPEATKSCGLCIRGLICHRCNVGLGYFRESADNLAMAIDYVMERAGGLARNLGASPINLPIRDEITLF